jgi:hypothetical protein
MEKQVVIKNIREVVKRWGEFSIGEVDGMDSPLVNSHGNLNDLAEHFSINGVTVEVYKATSFSSDSIASYYLEYEELPLDVLEEIQFITEAYDEEKQDLFDSCRDENF